MTISIEELLKGIGAIVFVALAVLVVIPMAYAWFTRGRG